MISFKGRHFQKEMMLQSIHSAQKTLAGIELMHMIKKGVMRATRGVCMSPAEQFYALAA